MKKIAFLLITLFTLSSCEKETFLDYYIDNQSSSVINVDGSDIIHSSDINQTINPNVKKDVAAWSKRGKQIEFFEPTTMFGNNLIISNAPGDTCTKDYKLLSNWTSDIIEQRAVARHEYVLVITEVDF